MEYDGEEAEYGHEGHDVDTDYAGFNYNMERLTCFTCQETLLRQPYMTDAMWEQLKATFLRSHPTDNQLKGVP